MSKTTVKINQINQLLDNVAGLDGYLVNYALDSIIKQLEILNFTIELLEGESDE